MTLRLLLLLLPFSMTFAQVPEPTTQASNILFSSLTTSSVTLSWSSGNGEYRLVVASTSPIVGSPTDGNFLYSSNSQFGSGDQITSGVYVVGNVNNSTPLNITGLQPSTTYFFQIFEYNYGVASPNYNYLVAPGAGNPANVTTLAPAAPTIQATNLTFSNAGTTSLQIDFTGGNGEGHLIVAKSGAPVDVFPTNGVEYTTSSSFGAGQHLGGGNYAVGCCSGQGITNLTANSTYHFRVFTFNGTSATTVYNTGSSTGNPAVGYTLATEPGTQASNITFTSIGATSLQLNFTNGNGSKRIVLARQGASVNQDPVDGTEYTASSTFGAGDVLGSGNYVVFSGTNGPVAITGLSPNTNYTFRVFEFNGSGAQSNYKTNSASNNPRSQSTQSLASQPGTQTSSLVLTPTYPGSHSISVTFNAGNGSSRILVAKQNAVVDAFPVDGTTYTVGPFGSGSELGTGNYVVGQGSGTILVGGLAPNTTYHIRAFEYNGSAGVENYNTNAATGNPASAITLVDPPTMQTSFITFTNVGTASSMVSWANGNGTQRLVVAREGAAVSMGPQNGNQYNGNANFSAALDLGSGNKIVYRGSGNSVPLTGLSPGVVYHFRSYELNGTGAQTNYLGNTAANNPSSMATLSLEPTTHPLVFQVPSVSEAQVSLSFSAASTIVNGFGYVILRRQDGNNPSITGLTDGIAPSSLSLPSGTALIANIAAGATTTFNDAGLIVDTQYNYLIIPYNYNGTTSQTYNYKTDGVPKTVSATPAFASVSNIVTAAAFSSPNINYAAFQEATDLTHASSAEIAQFLLQDGAGANDADNASTVLSSISFSIVNPSVIRRVAIYDGSTELAETTPAGSSVSFSGLNLVAPDDGSITFSLRVSFASVVVDNQQFSFTVASAASQSGGSGFAAGNAGGAVSSTAGDNNRIEVTATKIVFTNQPPEVIGIHSNVIPAPVLEARDALNNVDLDYSSPATVTNTGTLAMSNSPSAFSSGVLSFPVNFQFTTYGVTSLSVASGSLTNATSNAIVVRAEQPVSQPTALDFTNVLAGTMNASFSPSGSEGYLVLRKAGSAPSEIPQDGISYLETFGSSDVIQSSGAASFSSAGLSPGTVYFYSVYAYNGSGQSTNYLESNPLQNSRITQPDKPTVSLSNPTSSNFFADWNPVQSATGYKVDVSKNSDFSDFVDGYIAKDVAGTQINITGLEPSTEYFVQVRAVNQSGESPSSLVKSIVTQAIGGLNNQIITFNALPIKTFGDPPFSLTATASSNLPITYTSSNANVATVSGSSVTLVGFGTTTITASQAGNASFNAAPDVQQILIVRAVEPVAQPTALTFGNVGATSMTGTFTAASGSPEGYIALRKAGSPSSDPPVDGAEYTAGQTVGASTVAYVGSATSFDETGLAPNTSYHYAIYSFNGTSTSTNYLATSPLVNNRTTNPPLTPIKINTDATTSLVASGFGSTTVSANVTEGIDPKTVTLMHRKITVASFQAEDMPLKSGDDYEVIITEDMLDELGMEYYIVAEDESGSATQSSHSFIFRSVGTSSAEAAFPDSFNGFNGETTSYQMFSIPYILQEKDFKNIFDELGAYNKKTWRLWRYDPATKGYKEYSGGLSNTIELGKGYWFVAAKDLEEKISVGVGAVSQNDQSKPFTGLSILSGWNQIGNPYPFNIDWNVIMSANSGIGPLHIWSSSEKKYRETTVLKPWEGAFVFNSSSTAITPQIPVTAKTQNNGRIQEGNHLVDFDSDDWKLNLILNSQGMQSESAVGMHPHASQSFDPFDRIVLPRFMDVTDMYVDHPEFFAHQFAADRVPVAGQYAWEFHTTSDSPGVQVELSWNQEAIKNASASLVLIDLKESVWLDMKSTGTYLFTTDNSKRFRIVYSSTGDITPGVTLMGNAYPNPFTDEVTVPLLLENDNSTVQLQIFDMTGRKLEEITKHFEKAGEQKITWNGRDARGQIIAPGLLIYRLSNTGATRRLVKK